MMPQNPFPARAARVPVIAAAIVCLIAVASVLPGCGMGSDDAETVEDDRPSTPQRVNVPPKYATPEAFLDHCRRILQSERPDYTAFYDEFFWESKDHRVFEDYIYKFVLPRRAFYYAAADYFGEETLVNKFVRSERVTIPSDARVNDMGNGRAESLLVWLHDGSSTECTMQLVQINERWWISGYTADRVIDEIVDLYYGGSIETFRYRIGDLDTISNSYRSLMQRVNAREFGNMWEALEVEEDMLREQGYRLVY